VHNKPPEWVTLKAFVQGNSADAGGPHEQPTLYECIHVPHIVRLSQAGPRETGVHLTNGEMLVCLGSMGATEKLLRGDPPQPNYGLSFVAPDEIEATFELIWRAGLDAATWRDAGAAGSVPCWCDFPSGGHNGACRDLRRLWAESGKPRPAPE
jgi:hypothetical protein